jgi:hypothetical protein
VFLINSRLGHVSCSRHKDGRFYSEVTTTLLPSSLTKFHSFTLAHLRQSTCVGLRYGLSILNPKRLFLAVCSIDSLRPKAKLNCKSDNTPYILDCVTFLERCRGAGILTCCPSLTPFGFSLGPPNPWLITIAKETSDFRCQGLSP